jgi:ankyrin repeat protein
VAVCVAALSAQTPGSRTDPDGTTSLHWAVHDDDVKAAARLIGAGANVNARNDYGATPMSEAAVVGNAAMLELLLEAGADVESPNADGQTALMLVSRTGRLDAARLLLRYKANVNACGRRPSGSPKW